MRLSRIFLLLILLNITAGAQNLPNAPDFTLPDINGNSVTLSDYLGSGPIFISFWATWCKPCKQEMKALKKIYGKYSESGFTLLALSVDSERSIAKIKPYVKSHRFEFPILLDSDGEVARRYYAQVIPFSVLIDKQGKIIWSHTGYRRGDEIELEKMIKKLLTVSK